MSLSTTTIIVLMANGLAAVLCAGLLMLVLWQAPRQRANQLFALVMFTLGAYCIANGFGRFIDDLKLDPEQTTYIALSIYGSFVVAIYFFASAFATHYTPTMRLMRIVGLVWLVFHNLALWTDNVMINVRPRGSRHGDYQGDFTTLGLLGSTILILYTLVAALTLYRSEDERARSLWPAPLWVIAGMLSATFIWPRVPIPLNAILLAGAAVSLGLPVLRYELFNPRAELHAQLARKYVELEEANRMKSRFLANMSHELRTPLNSIIGYTELIINGTYGVLNDTQRDRLEKVVRNGHNLLSLINDVLDLNRIESGRATLERRIISTPMLLDNVLSTVEPLVSSKGLTLSRRFDTAPSIYADETRARQIVTNILANAIKFTHEGSITVRAFENDERQLQLEIADTGIGIESGQIDAVFAEFRQIDSSTTREYEGTGLGMAITKRLVEMHGGRIWLESTPGQGTTFFVTLPTTHALADRVPAASPQAVRHPATVLIIDDNQEAREMLADTLRNAGYQIATAANGTEGLARARKLRPTLITLDVMMPGLDGWQVLGALKNDPATRTIPVVIVSIIENRPLALSLGASDALAKPLDRARLLAVLDHHLAAAHSHAPILVVDDRQDDRELIASALEHKGYTVECVSGGPQALHWLADHAPSLILLDLMMPEISGFDVLAHVRSTGRLVDVPVIVITAKEITSDEQTLLRQQCAALVYKGFAGPDALLRAVHTALNKGASTPVPDSERVY